MSRIFTRLACILVLISLTTQMVFAQSTTISGTVTDNLTKETLAGVAITVKGRTVGTSTNENGRFTLSTSEPTPFTIAISYIGYKTVEQVINGSSPGLLISMEAQAILGQEVVVAASRTPERILESPVSIERLGQAAIRETAAPSFYDALTNLKGVESSAQSITFKSVNTRGFNANGNTRFNQYVDGMDNQAPGLNFSVGNIIGMSELDLDNVELLPGASSALYGAGGINGTMLLTSKSPYTSQGVSFQLKTGMNHLNDPNTNTQPFQEANVRFAKAWNKFAFKTNVSLLTAEDWQADDYTNFDRTARTQKAGNRSSDPNYDGINVYGDEVSSNMKNVANSVVNAGTVGFVRVALGIPANVDVTSAQIAAVRGNPATLAALNGFLATNAQTRPFFLGLAGGIIPDQAVSRTGYNEKDLVDYNARSFKTSTSFHYKLSNTVEAIAQANWGMGTSVYTGSDRYSLRNFSIGQYKLELKGQDFMLRGYTTQERSGDSYISSILGVYINETSKLNTTWFPQYVGNYVGARSAGLPDAQAHTTARSAADVGRFQGGSAQFEAAKNKIINTTLSSTTALGAKFDDKSNLWHYEGMYNFTNALKDAVELQVGASYRVYDLNSAGTIFDDLNREIDISEYGGFVQVGKKLADKLKLTFSGRYDKSMNFEGRFTPRITGVFTVAPNNNIRASFQTGYRNPTTQNQYIDLSVLGGATRLIGGLPESIQKYNLNTNKGFTDVSYRAFLASSSAGAPNPALLQTYTFDAKGVRPESVKAYELGYRGLLGSKVLIDTYGYFNRYKDFITAVDVYQLQTRTPTFTRFGVPVNAAGEVTAYGAAMGIDYQVAGNYNLSGNFSYNKLGDIPTTYINDFNTPTLRYNLALGNREVVKNVGFNVSYRWQDSFYWNSSFSSGAVPSFGTVDAQVNLKIPSVNSMIKIGASDLLNKYYRTSYGNPQMGGMYYVGFSFNQ